jgi:hypothetical protein
VFVVAGPVLADRIGVAVWLGVTHEPCGPVWVLFPGSLLGVVGLRIISQCIAPHSAHCRARITASAVKHYPAGVLPWGHGLELRDA